MGWWQNFLSGRKISMKPAFDGPELAIGKTLRIDVHSHIVPGVDDGCSTLEESLQLIERLFKMGYSGAVVTPHIHSDIYPNSRHTLIPAFKQLKQAVGERWRNFTLELAAEYFLDEHFADCIASGDLLHFEAVDEIGQSVKCVLFELGFHEPPMNCEKVIFDLQMAGYQGVLAHAERYPYWHQNPDEIQALSNRGIWITVNAASLAGAHGPEMYHMAHELLENGTVKMICSDAHNLRHMDCLLAISKSPVVHRWIESGVMLSNSVLV